MSERLTAEQVVEALDRFDDEMVEAGTKEAGLVRDGIAHARHLIQRNLIESDDERRARFERWYRDSFGGSSPSFNETQLMWMAWNASQDFRRGDA